MKFRKFLEDIAAGADTASGTTAADIAPVDNKLDLVRRKLKRKKKKKSKKE